MKLTQITPADTGLRALALWDAEGTVTYGTLPTGLEAMKVQGGLYIRRRRHRVSYWIKGARVPNGGANLPIPPFFSPQGPIYPSIIQRPSRTADPITLDVGSGTIYLIATPGTTIVGWAGNYAPVFEWDSDSVFPLPHQYPGLPA